MAKRRCSICKTSAGRKRSVLEPVYIFEAYLRKLGFHGARMAHVSCIRSVERRLEQQAQRRGLPMENIRGESIA